MASPPWSLLGKDYVLGCGTVKTGFTVGAPRGMLGDQEEEFCSENAI
jgi:hypothetical protein